MKPVAPCCQTDAFKAQLELLQSVHWSVSQTVAPMSQMQKVAAGAATTRSVGQTIARVVSHLKVLNPQNLQCKPSESHLNAHTLNLQCKPSE